jgi:hypothetical protein
MTQRHGKKVNTKNIKSTLNYENSVSVRGNKPHHVKQVEQPEWDRSYHQPPLEQKPVGHLTSVKQFHDL